MIAAAIASLKVISGDGAMMRESMKTITTSATAPTYASRIDGRVKCSRVRYATAPRRRSWGSTSSTTNSRIIGTASRRLPPQSKLFGIRPVGR